MKVTIDIENEDYNYIEMIAIDDSVENYLQKFIKKNIIEKRNSIGVSRQKKKEEEKIDTLYVKKQMKELDINQDDVAEVLGIKRNTISRVINNTGEQLAYRKHFKDHDLIDSTLTKAFMNKYSQIDKIKNTPALGMYANDEFFVEVKKLDDLGILVLDDSILNIATIKTPINIKQNLLNLLISQIYMYSVENKKEWQDVKKEKAREIKKFSKEIGFKMGLEISSFVRNNENEENK